MAYAQAPMRNYGEYKYVYSLDKSGNKTKATAFPRIKPIVVTTNFLDLHSHKLVICTWELEVCGKIQPSLIGLDTVMDGISILTAWVFNIAIFLYQTIMNKSESKRITKMA